MKESFKMGKRTLKQDANLEIQHDCRLKLFRNEFYLHVPVSRDYQHKNPCVIPSNKASSCGIDPGVRSFLTIFDEHGITEACTDNLRFKKLKQKIDCLKYYHKKKCRIQRAQTRLDNLIDDMHWKTSTMITNYYEHIFMGQLDSQKCLIKSNNRTMNRDINLLKPYEFRCRLKWLAIKKDRKMWVTPEHYTSKTCGKCGELTSCGSSKVYTCDKPGCEYTIDRDFNASRNILMRGLITNQK